MINKILKDSTINNKESLINDVLNENTINNKNIIKNEKNNNNVITFVETPMCIKSKRAVLNPRSNDNKSSQYSIALSLYYKEIGNDFNRITKIKPYINNFNWNNINFPPIKQDYENFEINNPEIALNVYQINNEKITQFYKSNYNKIKEVNLLLLENKHYVCIKNLESLLS